MSYTMDPADKMSKEEFVSNHTGTSAAEISILSFCAPLSILLLGFLEISAPLSKFKKCVLEMIVINIPLLMILTVGSEPIYYAPVLVIMSFTMFLFFINLKLKLWRHDLKTEECRHVEMTEGKYYPFITSYRGSMLVTTAACILAVDFPIFPRRFVKTENFGIGLMDVGVGSFVFASGLVSPEVKMHMSRSRWSLEKSLQDVLPMIALGFFRLISVKISGYQEHVTEYGVHWNFFFTLAFTKLISSLLFTTMHVRNGWSFAMVLSMGYEFILRYFIGVWILSPDTTRDDWISANREGIYSLPGYVAIYMSGATWGHDLTEKISNNSFAANFSACKMLVIYAIIAWVLFFLSYNEVFLPPSRRLVNWSYYTWILTYNLSLLLAFLICDLFLSYSYFLKVRLHQPAKSSLAKRFKGQRRAKIQQQEKRDVSVTFSSWSRVPYSLQAISQNGLAYFALANVATGVVNLSIKTLQAPTQSAILILALYLVGLNSVINICFSYNIRLKFW